MPKDKEVSVPEKKKEVLKDISDEYKGLNESQIAHIERMKKVEE